MSKPKVDPKNANPRLEPKVWPEGMMCSHNMPCCVHSKEPAVLSGSGVFLPSWKAQAEGWMLIKAPRWLRWLLRRYQA